MTYIDGFVLACPEDKKDAFIAHARTADAFMIGNGAIRVVECWGDDVPDGQVTDFRRAVKAKPGEAVLFSWVEWPDKAKRDAAMAKIMDEANPDPRFDPVKNPMPFDGKRMIFGGFVPVVDLTP